MGIKTGQKILEQSISLFSAALVMKWSLQGETLVLPVLLLLSAITLDFITGIWSARGRSEQVSSQVFIQGLWKKWMLLMVLFSGVILDGLLFYAADLVGMEKPEALYVTIFVAAWLTVHELLSVLENMVAAGVPFPPFLQEMLIKMMQNLDERKGEQQDAAINSAHQSGETDGEY